MLARESAGCALQSSPILRYAGSWKWSIRPYERCTAVCAAGSWVQLKWNKCRQYASFARGASAMHSPTARRTAACAIVPAYPNELTPPTCASSAPTAARCTGSPNLTVRSLPPTCGLSDRSC
eukprot:3292583-Prymnesium_polylepis.1